jgi:uncharacterized protein (UPF0332 family)
MQDLQRGRLDQAREALAEAQALREAEMDISFVLNNLYLAYYYPILALVYDGRVPDSMQSVTIGMFEQRFVASGKIDGTYLTAARRMFELKPKCTGGCLLVAPNELDRLFDQASVFIALVEEFLRGIA